MNREKLYDSALTKKDCDDWFSLLKGKKVKDAHPEIQQDARILRILADEYAQEQQEKKREHQSAKNNIDFTWSTLKPVLALLVLTLSSFFIYYTVNDGNNNNQQQMVDAQSDTNLSFGFNATNQSSQSGLVQASNNPVMVAHLTEHIAQLSHTFKDLSFEQIEHQEGIMVRIIIQQKPSKALIAQLHAYGFSDTLGKQYIYFKQASAD